MSQLFGYSLDRKKGKGSEKGPSFVHKDSDDAAQPIVAGGYFGQYVDCLLYTSPSPRDYAASRMPSSA